MTDTNDSRQFFLSLADVEVQLEGDAFRDRTLELQKYLLVVSFLCLVTSLGVYSVKELTVGPAVLVTQKAVWISLFEFIAIIYCASVYGFAAWIDLAVYRSRMRQIVGQTLPLLEKALKEQSTSLGIRDEMDDVGDQLQKILGQHEEAARIVALSNEHLRLARLSMEVNELSMGKLVALGKVVRRTKVMRRFAFTFEVGFPMVLAFIAAACVYTATAWKW